jgi:ribonuclease-3
MLGFCPNDITLFQQACRHRSMGRNNQERGNNERLEFLGDAVLSAIASDIIYKTFNNKDEGFLSKTRSKIVQRETLNHVALKLGLDKIVEITIHSQSHNNNTYGNALEALIGAIYLDQGYDFANRLLINDIYGRYLSIDEMLQSETDFKSRLIEWCQKNHHSIEFRTEQDSNHSQARPVFHSTVYISGIAAGHGTGDSKKQAEQQAAFSVSQPTPTTITDESSAAILDHIDQMVS